MAVEESVPVQSHDDTNVPTEDASDYGSDIDDATLDDIFSQSYSQSAIPLTKIKLEDVEEAVLPERDESDTHVNTIRLIRLRADVEHTLSGLDSTAGQLARIRETLNAAISGLGETPAQSSHQNPVKRAHSVEIEYDESNRSAWPSVQIGVGEVKRESPPAEEPNVQDQRSPIDRFRKAPRKPLSVTDLVSPAWCELQYWYSLTKYGRIKRTPAMKQGSKIHKQMEEQVHTEVPVEIKTKEDKLGLRMWNIIQGLRTLRATGLTRELEVFGVVDGEVVNGIIDEISYNCPDEKLEAQMLEKNETTTDCGKKNKKEDKLSADQRTLADFFPGSQNQADILNSQGAWFTSSQKTSRTLYLLDIKTRKSKTLPKLGSQMRPTQMQLMLYRRLLNDLAANKVEADRIFDRYNLDPHTPFSDTFIAQLGAIDFQSSQSSSVLEADDGNDEVMPPSQDQASDPLDEILSYNTLSSLWSHMIAEFSKTISVNASSSALSPLLTAEFRASTDGAVIGQRSFTFDAEVLDNYVSSEMAWWRGERETQGVQIEEAYKCGICEFAEGCTWRKGKIEEATQKARLRNSSRAKSQI